MTISAIVVAADIHIQVEDEVEVTDKMIGTRDLPMTRTACPEVVELNLDLLEMMATIRHHHLKDMVFQAQRQFLTFADPHPRPGKVD